MMNAGKKSEQERLEVADGLQSAWGFAAVYIGVKVMELGGLFAARLSLETRILAAFR